MMRLVASMPFMFGMPRSITTTSGDSVSASRTLPAVGCFADHPHIGLALQYGAQPVADDRMVISQEDSNGLHFRSFGPVRRPVVLLESASLARAPS